MAGETRRHMVKAGAAGTRGHAHEPANGVTAELGGSHRLQTAPGGARGHGVRGPHAWSLPGFRAKGNRGVGMLVVRGQLGPRMPPLPVQAAPFSWGRAMAELSSWLVSHHQTHQRLRGALRKGVHPQGSLAAPSSEVKPRAQGSSEPQGLCEGMPRPRAEAFSEGEQQNPAAC